MSEIVVETQPIETVIELGDGTVVDTTVQQEVQTVVSMPAEPVVIDLNSGARGEPGSAILSGSAYPMQTQGTTGDIYVVTEGTLAVGNVYRKIDGVWTEVGNIRGPAGGVDHVNGKGGPDVVLDKVDIGLGLADNTSDVNKPVSTAQQEALDLKSDIGHLHVRADITDLQAALDGKADTVHVHTVTDVTGLTAALAGKEPTLATGVISEYYRGDKTWQTLDKSAVGLANVDNTSDANKPVSTATQTALDGKENTIAAGTIAQYWRGDKSWQILDPAAVGLGNVVNLVQVDLVNDQTIAGVKTFSVSPIVPTPTTATQAANKSYVDSAASSAVSAVIDASPSTLDTLNELAAALGDDPNFATTMTNSLATKEPVINAGTTAQYWRGDKTWQTLNKAAVGLANVDNTTDLLKPISTATQAALDGKANTVHGHSLSDANITGVIPNEQLPTRLDNILSWVPANSDMNNGTDTGWFVVYNPTNGPAGQPVTTWTGEITNYNNYITQTMTRIGDFGTDTQTWRRVQAGAGNWGAWYKLALTEGEQDARNDIRYRNTLWTDGNMRSVRDVVQAIYPTNTLNRYMRINTNLPAISGNMVKIHIKAYSYTLGTVDGWLTVYLYNSAGGTLHMPKWVNSGDYCPDVTVAKDASNNLVVVLDGDWRYARVAVEEVEASSSTMSSAHTTGWTITNVTSLTGLTLGTMSSHQDFADAVVRVNHGATASTPRPAGVATVQWYGSVAPTNAATNDEWINTA